MMPGTLHPGTMEVSTDSMSTAQFHNEVGAIDTYAELSTQTGHTGALWSAPQFPSQTASPPLDVPEFPQVSQVFVFCVGHWVAQRSGSGGGSAHVANLHHLFDYNKPSGFQFKL